MSDGQDGEAHEEAAFSIAKKNKKMQSSAQSNGYGSSSQQKTATQTKNIEMGVDSSKMMDSNLREPYHMISQQYMLKFEV